MKKFSIIFLAAVFTMPLGAMAAGEINVTGQASIAVAENSLAIGLIQNRRDRNDRNHRRNRRSMRNRRDNRKREQNRRKDHRRHRNNH